MSLQRLSSRSRPFHASRVRDHAGEVDHPIRATKSLTVTCTRALELRAMSERILKRRMDYSAIADSYISRKIQTLKAFDSSQIASLVEILGRIRESRSTIFIAGNGGSASTAEHIAVDWMLGTELSDPPLRVVSIAQSAPSISATGNDHSFDDVFSRQLKSLATRGDLLLVISASGNSANLLKLASLAQDMEVNVVSMTGFDGGKLAKVADLSVHVPTSIGDYGVAEDLHLMIGHIVKEALICGEHREC